MALYGGLLGKEKGWADRVRERKRAREVCQVSRDLAQRALAI